MLLLSAQLDGAVVLTASSEGDWIVFRGGAFGEHKLSRSHSDTARILSHWHSYVAASLAAVSTPARHPEDLGFCRRDGYAHARTFLCDDWKVRQ